MDGSDFVIPDQVAKLVFDELKTHLAQRWRTLRSKTPDGVRQGFFGWMLAHYAVCWLMQPSRVSPCRRLVVDIAPMSPIRFSHRGIAPHQFAPRLGAHKRLDRGKRDLTLFR